MAQKISKEEVEHVARLVRLHLTSEEVEKFTGQLGEVLEYVDKLPEAEKGIKNQELRIKSQDMLREDKVVTSEIGTGELLKNAPQVEGTSIKVPAVLGGGDE